MEQNTYKYASIVLALIALIFAYLYFSKVEPNAGDLYQSVSDKVGECSEDITEWKTKYSDIASSTEKQADLDKILENCQEVITEGQAQLQ